ncbi:MAG TPA: hypothetical protein VKH18_12445, partial [Terriglobales bacterium]|nr:hypothetical protein [Terriglobales bacterium]
VRGTRNPLAKSVTGETVSIDHLALETASGPTPLATAAQRLHVEQMYRLANIFASIFETLPIEHVDAIATARDAA